MLKRFGEAYPCCAAHVPRWLLLLLIAFGVMPAAVGAQSDPAVQREQAGPVPAVLAKIKVDPEHRNQWMEAFERHIAPAILEAIESGDEIVDVSYFEAIVPGQEHDFLLVFRAKSFEFYDRRRVFPHYKALFRRLGVEEGRRIIAEMSEWETSVSVTLVRSYALKR